MDEALRDICDRLLELIYEDETNIPIEILAAADELQDYISSLDEEE
jgi:hypothetical protein